MKLTLLSPTKALSKAYLKQSLKREQIEQFKSALRRMFERIRAGESEEHHKNIVADFLKDTWYKPAYEPAETAETSNDKKLINLYKLLSPPHLLKLPFANDSNSLNREFYSELLHIIGLEEVKDKGKKLIRRKAAGARNDGSLLENTISILASQRVPENLEQSDQFGATDEDRLFSIGLELCITWLDRILFLKLLEGQLIIHHRGDRNRAFLNSRKIEGFDGLQELFFEVLAVRMNDRAAEVQTRYGAIPYLNSSLFEPTDLERKAVHISSLKERRELPFHTATILKDSRGKRRTGGTAVLSYLPPPALDRAAEKCLLHQGERLRRTGNAAQLRLTDRGLVVQTPASRGQELNHPLRFRCRNWSFVFALQGPFCG